MGDMILAATMNRGTVIRLTFLNAPKTAEVPNR